MSRIYLFLLLCTFSFTGIAQNIWQKNKWNAVSVTGGINQIKEFQLAPKVHSGFTAGANYEYMYIGDYISGVRINLDGSGLASDMEKKYQSANIRLRANYQYLFLLFDTGFMSYYFGFEGGMNYSVSMYPNWDESHLYWANYVGVGIKNRYGIHINDNNHVIINFALPFFVVASRPQMNREYKMDDFSLGGILKSLHSHPEVTLFKRNAIIELSVEYQFWGYKKYIPAFYYNIYCSRLQSKTGDPYQDMVHQFGLKIYL